MKTKEGYREYENQDYFELIDMSLHLLVTREDKQETLTKIRSKLKGEILNVFDFLRGYVGLIILADLTYKKESYDFENFDKRNKLSELKKETEKLLNDYLASLDKTFFLRAISEITYWIAKVEGAGQIKLHKNFLSSWAQWHNFLERRDKNKRRGQRIKEKLRLIIGDKVDDLGGIDREHDKETERFKAGKGDVWVNIDQEIDLERAKPNKLFIFPTRWRGGNSDFRIIEEHTKIVTIKERNYSLREYYERVKDEIDEKWLKDKDLLKQVITIYLIKKCQNGDEEAFQKLFGLYRDRAKKVVLFYIKKRGNLIETSEVEGREMTILEVLLRGDNPSRLYYLLDKSRSNKKGIDLLNKRAYASLDESYRSMFVMINLQFKQLNDLLGNLEKSTKDFRNRLKKAKKEEKRKEYSRKIFSLSQHTLSKINFTPTLFELFTPLHLLNISSDYNKYLFKPAPNRNLTTWLFGDKGRIWNGMVWCSLCNLFDKRSNKKDELFDEDKDSDSDTDKFWEEKYKRYDSS